GAGDLAAQPLLKNSGLDSKVVSIDSRSMPEFTQALTSAADGAAVRCSGRGNTLATDTAGAAVTPSGALKPYSCCTTSPRHSAEDRKSWATAARPCVPTTHSQPFTSAADAARPKSLTYNDST